MKTAHPSPGNLILGLALLALSSPAAAVTVNFDTFANNTLLTTQLNGQGVTFGPNGVIVRTMSGAFSSPNVSVPVPAGDISNAEWVAVFASGQQDVSVRIRPNANGVPSATLRAYNAANGELLSTTTTFANQTDWRSLSASRAASDIRKVVITAAPSNSNFIQVDNLVFTSAPPPPPPDTAPPLLTIVTPLEAAVLTQAQTNVRITASDDRDLLTVKGHIRHLASNSVVSGLDFCGSATSGGCAESVDNTVQAFFQPPLEGDLRITVTACDAANNCTTRTRNVVLDLPAPPARVSAERVEINQGVQGRLVEIGRPGDDRVASLEALLVAGRHTLVRVYPLTDGDPRPNYSADLHVIVIFDDGTTREFRLLGPNAGPHSITVEPRPGTSAAREQEYLEMRLDLGRTLDFVIPQLAMMRSLGTETPEAVRLEMRVEAGNEPVTGWLKASLRPEVRLIGQDVILRGITGAVTPTPSQTGAALRYAYQVLPTTLAEGGFGVTGPGVLYFGGCPWFQNVFQCVAWALTRVQPQAADVDAFQMIFAFPPHPAESVDDNPDELGAGFLGRIAVAAWGDDGVGHALGHALGFRNAGKGTNDRVTLGFGPHGEVASEDWPYAHGGSLGNHVFGVFISTSLADQDNPVTGGEFAVTLIDPCPGGTLAERGSGCQKEPETHDFMSWANSGGGVPSGLRPRHHNWISALNWNRMYEKLRQGIIQSPLGTTRAAASTAWPQALFIDGILDAAGEMQLLPIVRQAVAPEALAPPPPGPYRLELLARGGALLHSRTFDVIELGGGAEQQFLMMQVVPAIEGVARVRVKKGEQLILDRQASAHAPAIELLSPAGGEAWPSGEHTVDWTASDADGGPLYSQLEYSADRGATWQMLALLGPGEPSHLEIDTSELEASAEGVFRVTVSDGLLSTSGRSLCPMAVGVAAPAACTGSCVPGVNHLCLGGDRFQIEADWQTPAGQSGAAVPIKLTEDTGYFWFFDQENVEAVIKVLDGCGLNDRFWVFAGGLTNVLTTLRVTDTITGQVKEYVNPADTAFQPIQDTGAFATCSVGASASAAAAPRSLHAAAGALTLNQNRFKVEAHWQTANGEGNAEAIELTDDTGYLWFFDPDNVEAVVKVLDGCAVDGRYWVFAGGLTDVNVVLKLTDTTTGVVRTYTNPAGTPFQPIQDTGAFASCP